MFFDNKYKKTTLTTAIFFFSSTSNLLHYDYKIEIFNDLLLNHIPNIRDVNVYTCYISIYQYLYIFIKKII